MVFSCISLKDLFVSSLSTSTCLPVIFYISLRKLFTCSLKGSIIFMKCNFRYEYFFLGVLWYSGLAVVGELRSDDVTLHWLLLLIFLCLLFAISMSGVNYLGCL